ncbi:MAG: DUF2752 domain-containing protein [Acidobacteriota bacterium]|jgi:hypothetical protein|nr:DUF2752 domain-containing protein [Acidobacteriota bacterium]
MTNESLLNNKILSSTTERILAAAGLFVFAAGSFFVGFFNPSTERFFPACPLLVMTGFACSGCGLTRGFHALFHGDILTALSFNALIPIYVFLFSYLVFYLLSVVIRGRGFGFRILTPWTLGIFLTIALLFGFIRNIPAYPFSILFP